MTNVIVCHCCDNEATICEPDPFMMEIHDEVGPNEHWCDDCFQERCDEI